MTNEAEIGQEQHGLTAMTDVEADECQDWKGMDGAIAYHLIDRHAENWNQIGAMMNAWLRANGGTLVPND